MLRIANPQFLCGRIANPTEPTQKKTNFFSKKFIFFLTVMKIVVLLQCSI